MKTITLNLFSFAELKENARAVALDDLRHVNVEHDEWHRFALEDFAHQLQKVSVDVNESDIYFSLHVQGSGASFTGKIDDLLTFCDELGIKLSAKLKKSIAEGETFARFVRKSHMYSHEGTCETEIVTDMNGLEIDDLEEAIEAWRRDVCHDLHQTLEKEYEYLTSDEGIIGTIDANEWTFEGNGKMRNV